MELKVTPGKILRALLIAIGLLFVANCLSNAIYFGFDLEEDLVVLIDFFNFDREENIPTMFASLQLIVASLLLGIIGAKYKSVGEAFAPWFLLGLVFLAMAVDEIAQIHERIGWRIHDKFDTTGPFFFAWVVPYSIGTLILVVVLSRFLTRLPKETVHMFIASGAIYVSGAIGLEMLGAGYFEIQGLSIRYAFFTTFEETLEMLGITLFIYALLTHITREFKFLTGTVIDERL